MKTIRFFVSVAAILIALGCGREKSGRTVTQPNGEKVVSVNKDDEIMIEAIGKAKQSLPHFLQELKKPNGRTFGIKASFKNDLGEVEYMWVAGVTVKNDVFHGELANEPFHIAKLHEFDEVDVKLADVIDWSIYEGDKKEGAYTQEALEKIAGYR